MQCNIMTFSIVHEALVYTTPRQFDSWVEGLRSNIKSIFHLYDNFSSGSIALQPFIAFQNVYKLER